MFSASRLVAAAAVIAVGGGVLVTQGPSTSEDATAPAAVSSQGTTTVTLEDPSMHPPRATDGTVFIPISSDELNEVEVSPGVFEWVTEPLGIAWRSRDERLSGSGTMSEHGVQHFHTFTGLRASRWIIENEGGTWVGRSDGFSYPEVFRDESGFIVFEGTGDYGGLSAYVQLGDDVGAGRTEFSAVIFPSTAPAPPDGPLSE